MLSSISRCDVTWGCVIKILNTWCCVDTCFNVSDRQKIFLNKPNSVYSLMNMNKTNETWTWTRWGLRIDGLRWRLGVGSSYPVTSILATRWGRRRRLDWRRASCSNDEFALLYLSKRDFESKSELRLKLNRHDQWWIKFECRKDVNSTQSDSL